MPFFKLRRGDAASASPAGPAIAAPSVEVLRKRARHRLIGASVLVLLGVLGFPLLFDTQPRPVAVDIPIEIPGKNAVKPLVLPPPAAATAPTAAATQSAPEPAPAAVKKPAPETVTAAASLSPKEEIFSSKPAAALALPAPAAIKKEAKPEPRPAPKAEARPEPKPEAKPHPEPKTEPKAEAKAETKPPAKPEARPAPKPPAAGDDGARAVALLNGAAPPQAPKVPVVVKPSVAEETRLTAAESKGRMAVQVGAFADAAKADETRRKLEKAGLATYTQVAETKDGKRIRVRVGPFATKAEAEKAINKIRSLDLPIAVLSF